MKEARERSGIEDKDTTLTIRIERATRQLSTK
jgi:hypothetical protein